VLQNLLIIVGVASILYPMRNLLGLITRFCIYGMIIWTIFFCPPLQWDSRIMFVAILQLKPGLISLISKIVSYRHLDSLKLFRPR